MMFGKVKQLYAVFACYNLGLSQVNIWKRRIYVRHFSNLTQISDYAFGLKFGGFLGEEIPAATDAKQSTKQQNPTPAELSKSMVDVSSHFEAIRA